MPKITKILVANRGEIACRIIRTCREMGIATVAVYSEADRQAPHVRLADEAYLLGPPPSNESYLLADKLIEIAKASGTDAIHPGYGFLSERSGFAKAIKEAGMIFIGPGEAAIEVMGDKLRSKEAVAKFGVPLVPGSEGALSDKREALDYAEEIGYPVMLKASAGGGGKGMRIAHNKAELEEQFDMAVSEATKAFGDGSVFIERFIQEPKHIEVQVLGDQHGNLVHLFERECSIQRRHQKVIEEAPSAVVDEKLRQELGEAALNVARACDYYSAGTVEFIMEPSGEFFFLEMNTRLQVEHPVTEMVTGVDLVEWQIRVAQGETLGFSQEDLSINGHAIESRVYAEDPSNNFMADVGHLSVYQPPKGPGVRVDDGMEQGMDVPIYYDPMIAKLVTHGPDRQSAIKRMVRAIEEYSIIGCQTTLPFCRYVMEHPRFQDGRFSTKFVEQDFSPSELYAPDEEDKTVAALMAFYLSEGNMGQSSPAQKGTTEVSSAWLANRRW